MQVIFQAENMPVWGKPEQSVFEQRREIPAVRLIHGELDLAEESGHRIFIELFIHSTQMYCESAVSGFVPCQALVCDSAYSLVGKADIKQIITQMSVQFEL